MTETKVIIDCGGGIDDAYSLLLLLNAHKHKLIQIEAITCVNGNMLVEGVVKNVFRALTFYRSPDIPVFQGASVPLLSNVCENIQKMTNDRYDGNYGRQIACTSADTRTLRKEHAVSALNRIVSEYPNQVDILCLGPLTNIALAIKMYPKFAYNVRKMFVMGGNLPTSANSTPEVEFNFYMDPESAYIVLTNSVKPLWLLPRETCLKSSISHEWRKNVLGVIQNQYVYFINYLEYGRKKPSNEKGLTNYIIYDAVLAAMYLVPTIATNILPRYVEIELKDNTQRGLVKYNHLLNSIPNVQLIVSFDSEFFKNLLLFAANSL
ncbi:uncharacterized protein LOC108622947 [Ceratina calcarata]|uniref:Uncharacterized protein LOC108622947 n=1 Tax=Ceratina calcarata TaxID=156304 RepID=A0AAJ7N4L2_9HYME|nr:uncharacterized protein LOC108622947 [Ceratina calcarata]